MPFIRPARFYRFNQTQAAAPPPPPPPPAGGTEILITKITVTDTANSAQTNQILEIGVPMTAATMDGGFIRVFDDDGAGGIGAELANFQNDNNSLQLDGSIRFTKVTGVIPSVGASATRVLQVWRTSAARVTTFTPIALADVSALAGAVNGLVKVEMDISGTTHSASVFDIIVNGSTTFHKAGRWYASETWRSGPTCTEWRMRMAPRAGATPHVSGSGLSVEFHLAAFKAGVGAVSASNPIFSLRCDTILKNADGARVSAATREHFYGLNITRATSPTDATMISTNETDPDLGTHKQSYPRSTQATTLTLSNAASGAYRTGTLGTGSWATDITGAYIRETAGSGLASVVSAESAGQVRVFVWDTFSTALVPVSGWTIEGVGHPYNAEWRVRQWIGNKKTINSR